MKTHQVLARHILDAIDNVEKYTKNMSKEEFLENFMVQDAVVRNLEIIGEASKNIDLDIKRKFPEIPWRDILAMRNKLVHEYFRVDNETVWNVIQLELKDLRGYANSILNFRST